MHHPWMVETLGNGSVSRSSKKISRGRSQCITPGWWRPWAMGAYPEAARKFHVVAVNASPLDGGDPGQWERIQKQQENFTWSQSMHHPWMVETLGNGSVSRSSKKISRGRSQCITPGWWRPWAMGAYPEAA